MGQMFFLGALSTAAVASLFRPWIGVVSAYLIAVLTPQAVWFWNFVDVRPVFWIMVPTIVGFGIGVARGIYDLQLLNNKRNVLLLGLWFFYTLSYLVGPYANVDSPYRFVTSQWASSTLNNIFILYFMGCLCIDNEKKLKALVGVLAFSVIYLIYWANDQYLSGNLIGRLAGPVDFFGNGIYSDENNFAMLFVVATPFLWYLGYAMRYRIACWGMWLVIPFGWHAVFLTASRGGLVGLAVTTLLVAWRTKNRWIGILLIPALFFAYTWQAGDLMRGRAETIQDFAIEESASSRLDAWAAATNMIVAHPVTGVGLASFSTAFPSYSQDIPREAHNTFFQIAGESGIFAGIAYIGIVAICILSLWRNGSRLRRAGIKGSPSILYLVNEAVLVAFTGLAICSLFLSLQMFEIFYLLCLLTNAVLYVSAKEKEVAVAEEEASSDVQSALGQYPARRTHRLS